MKKICLSLLLLMIPAQSFAYMPGQHKVTPESHWSEIYSDWSVRASVPQIPFPAPLNSGADGSYFVPVTYVCVDGDQLKTTTPVRLSKDVRNLDSNGHTKSTETVYVGEFVLSTPRTFTSSVEIRETNSEGKSVNRGWKDITYTYKLDGYVGEIWDNTQQYTKDNHLLFTKEASISSCAHGAAQGGESGGGN